MSFLAGNTDKLPQPEQKMLGQDHTLLPTNEQARPVPWFLGTRRLGITFISNAFNQVSEPVKKDAGKDEMVTGWNYSASFAALICVGQIDRLVRVYIDDEVAWEGPLVRSGNSAVFTIVGRGQVRIYWGTETQGIDSHLALSGEGHSPMRGQCYAVFQNFFFGFQKTTAPKIEFVVARWPSRSWMTPGKIAMDNEYCNPVYALAELLQDVRTGAGLPNSALDTDAWNAAAAQVYTEGIGICPVLNRQMSLSQVFVQFAQYIDAFPTYNADGKLSIGLVRELKVTDPLLITKDDLLEEPTITAPSWEEAYTDVRVKYVKGRQHFQEASVGRPNAALRQILGLQRAITVDRSWITTRVIAERVWAAMSRAAAAPKLKGEFPLSGDISLRPGDLFFFCYPKRGLNILCRATRTVLSAPGTNRLQVAWEMDHSYLADAQVVAEEDEEPNQPEVTVSPIVHQRLLELPYGLKVDAYVKGATFLVARPSVNTTQFKVYLQKASGSFEEVLTSAGFCLHGLLQDRYVITDTFDEAIGMRILLDGPDVTLPNIPLQDALNNEWLLFVGNEIMSIFGAELIGTDEYRVYAIRGRYDTVPGVHLGGSDVFLVKRSDLPNYLIEGSTLIQKFKLQPVVLTTGQDLSEIDEEELNFSSRGLRPWAPKNLRAFDSTAPTYTTGQDIPLTWSTTVPDPGGEDEPRTVLEFYAGTTLRKTFQLPIGLEEFLVPNAQLQSMLGGEHNFTVRAYHRRGLYRSTSYDEITVTKI